MILEFTKTPNNHEPFPKNPDIARIFTQIGHSEELGTGIRNVYKYSKPYSNNKHVIFNEEDIFITEVPLKDMLEEVPDVNGRVKNLYEIIKTNPNKRTNELAKLMNTPFKTVEKWIAKLKNANKVEFRGSSKTGGYFIK